MKVFAISDLHLSINTNKPMNIFGPVWQDHFEIISKDWQEKVGKDDIVLISGDISWGMKLEEALEDLKEIAKLNGTKIMIRGNHDYWWKSITAIRKALPKDMLALQNDSLKIGNYIFCGTRGWAVSENGEYKPEDKVIFDREVIRLELSLKSAKAMQTASEEIFCLIHYPPFNSRTENSAFTALFEKYGVKKVIYGHLHGKNGRTITEFIKNGVTYYLTSCDKINNHLVLIGGDL